MAHDPDPKPAPALPQGGGRPTGDATITRGALGLAIRGLIGTLLGVILISAPAEAVLPFAMLASAVMLLEGVFVVVLIVLRIAHAREWQGLLSWAGWLCFGGLVVVCYGALLIRAMTVAPIVFTTTLGAFTILFGIALLVLAFRLRPRRSASPATRMLAGPMR
jgi:uncharacterized membrane protein HdeD (DUF308 family)